MHQLMAVHGATLLLYRLSYQGSPNMVFTWVKLRFLNLSTSDILGRTIIFVVGGFPLCCKMFSIILGFTHQIPVGPSFPIWQPKMSPKQFRSFLCGKIALVEYHWIKWIEKKKVRRETNFLRMLINLHNPFATEKTEEYLPLPFVYLDVGAVNLSIKAVSPEVLHAIFDHDDEQDNGQW